MRAFYALPGVLAMVLRSRSASSPSRTSCSATATATRTAASSPATGSCTAPRPRWSRCSSRSSRAHGLHAAAVPRPRRHGRPRRRPELPGHPGAAAGHGERADPPDRAGRGHRLASTPTPRSAGATSRRWSPPRSKPRCCTRPRARRRPSSTPRPRSARPASRPTASWSTTRRASPTTSSTPRRSARSPSSTSARARRRARPTARHRGPARDSVGLQLGPVPRGAAGLVRLRLRRSRPAWRRRGPARAAAWRCCSACTGSGRSFAPCCPTSTWCWPRATCASPRAMSNWSRTSGWPSASSARSRPSGERTGETLSLITGERAPAGLEPRAGALDRAPLPVPRSAQPPAGRADAPLPPARRAATPPASACSAASTSRSTASRRACAIPAERARRGRDPSAAQRLAHRRQLAARHRQPFVDGRHAARPSPLVAAAVGRRPCGDARAHAPRRAPPARCDGRAGSARPGAAPGRSAHRRAPSVLRRCAASRTSVRPSGTAPRPAACAHAAAVADHQHGVGSRRGARRRPAPALRHALQRGVQTLARTGLVR